MKLTTKCLLHHQISLHHALSLAKECYSMKLDLLTNATVVDDAIRFVSSKSKEMLRHDLSISQSSNNKIINRRLSYIY